jgi:hypothetical protein
VTVRVANRLERLSDSGARIQEVLAVIEDHQSLSPRQIRRGRLYLRHPRQWTHAEGIRDRPSDQLLIGNGRQLDPPHAAREPIEHLRSDLQGEPRLATAARAHQRQQPRLSQRRPQLAQFPVAPDEASELDQQIVRPRSGRHRRDRAGRHLQPVGVQPARVHKRPSKPSQFQEKGSGNTLTDRQAPPRVGDSALIVRIALTRRQAHLETKTDSPPGGCSPPRGAAQ